MEMNLEKLGLRDGQCLSRDTFHNAGWYNRGGDKIGWGDLSPESIHNIAKNLEDDEVFIILPESASFWNFVNRPGPIGALADVDRLSEKRPGMDYLIEHVRFVVTSGKWYQVVEEDGMRYSSTPEPGTVVDWPLENTHVVERGFVSNLLENMK
jgi:hypothetical protein